jgi:hypothetical protein
MVRFPIQKALRDKVPTLLVRARNTKTGQKTKIPVSLSIHFPRQAQESQAWQPLGAGRAFCQTQPDGNEVTFKGGGLRSLTTYFSRSFNHFERLQKLFPVFWINTFKLTQDDAQLILGGSPYRDCLREFKRTEKFREILDELDIELEAVPQPKAIYELLEFPAFTEDGEVIRFCGKDYFMNPDIMSPDQCKIVAEYVAKRVPQQTVLIDQVIAKLENGEEVEQEARQQVAGLFVKLTRPSVYKYQGKMGPRIGTIAKIVSNISGALRDILVEKGKIPEESLVDGSGQRVLKNLSGTGNKKIVGPNLGLDQIGNLEIKEVIDEQIAQLYGSAGLEISFPENTQQDLLTEEGVLRYLREIRNYCEENDTAAKALTEMLYKNTATQLAVIHGTGGHAGGCNVSFPVGTLRIDFTHKIDRPPYGERIFLLADFKQEGAAEESVSWHRVIPYQDFYEAIDPPQNFLEDMAVPKSRILEQVPEIEDKLEIFFENPNEEELRFGPEIEEKAWAYISDHWQATRLINIFKECQRLEPCEMSEHGMRYLNETGAPGGGSTRDDNVLPSGAFRDLDTLFIPGGQEAGQDKEIGDLIESNLPFLSSTRMRERIEHFYLKMKQRADYDLLHTSRWDSRQGTLVPGVFLRFTMLTGGEIGDYHRIKNGFYKVYSELYPKVREQLASQWYRELDEKLGSRPSDYTFSGLSQNSCQHLEYMMLGQKPRQPIFSLPRSL